MSAYFLTSTVNPIRDRTDREQIHRGYTVVVGNDDHYISRPSLHSHTVIS
jgi:hypothetical protein